METVFYKGRRYRSLRQMCRELNLPYINVFLKVKYKGYPLEEAVAEYLPPPPPPPKVTKKKVKEEGKPIRFGSLTLTEELQQVIMVGLQMYAYTTRSPLIGRRIKEAQLLIGGDNYGWEHKRQESVCDNLLPEGSADKDTSGAEKGTVS